MKLIPGGEGSSFGGQWPRFPAEKPVHGLNVSFVLLPFPAEHLTQVRRNADVPAGGLHPDPPGGILVHYHRDISLHYTKFVHHEFRVNPSGRDDLTFEPVRQSGTTLMN